MKTIPTLMIVFASFQLYGHEPHKPGACYVEVPCPSPTATPKPTPVPTVVPTPSPTPVPPTPTATPSPKPGAVVYRDKSCDGLQLDQLPGLENGWTKLPDLGRKIHVSASNDPSKNDPAKELYYVKTIAQAQLLFRKGQPDQILLKKGETFEGGNGLSCGSLGGKSSKELQVFSSYGSSPLVRPIVKFVGNTGLMNCNVMVNNFFLGHIDFQAIRNGTNAPYGLRLPAGITNFTIEGNRFQNFHNNISIEHGHSKNLVIRRNQILDSYSNNERAGHSQGAYLDKQHGLLMIENIFDHNGWKNRGIEPGKATVYNHNVYLMASSVCSTIKGNVFSRGAATGIQVRPGGIFEDNLVIESPMQITYGLVNGGSIDMQLIPKGVSGTIKNNTFINGVNLDSKQVRRGRSEISNAYGVIVTGNIYAHHESGPTYGEGFVVKGNMGLGIVDLVITDNIFYNLGNPIINEGGSQGTVTLKTETVACKRWVNEKQPDGTTKPVEKMVNVTGSSVYSSENVRKITPCNSGIPGGNDGFKATGKGFQQSNNQVGGTFVDPKRIPDKTWLAKVRNIHKDSWDGSLLAPAMNAWIKEGFKTK